MPEAVTYVVKRRRTINGVEVKSVLTHPLSKADALDPRVEIERRAVTAAGISRRRRAVASSFAAARVSALRSRSNDAARPAGARFASPGRSCRIARIPAGGSARGPATSAICAGRHGSAGAARAGTRSARLRSGIRRSAPAAEGPGTFRCTTSSRSASRGTTRQPTSSRSAAPATSAWRACSTMSRRSIRHSPSPSSSCSAASMRAGR